MIQGYVMNKADYGKILKKELLLALGCTEPIAIAYAAALVKKQLKQTPTKLDILVSGNIIKNVKGVIVPNTNGLRGIEVATVAGFLTNKPDSELEVLEYVNEEDISLIPKLIENIQIKITQKKNKDNLYIDITGYCNDDKARVVIEEKHTNVTHISKNDALILDVTAETAEQKAADYKKMSFEGLYEYSLMGDIDNVIPTIDLQVESNYTIAKIGLEHNYGMNIGKTVIKDAKSPKEKAIAYAAAGSDARMSGSTSPVVINSGSGNQGMTISLPIYVYCTSEGVEKEKMYRALVFANLVSIYIKSKIGSLSAFCGAVSAATAVSGAITYLKDGNRKQIEDSIKNSLSNLPGVICDGAKPSCAYKIYSSLDSAFLASELALNGIVAEGGCGIIFDDIEKTIAAVGTVGKDGMKNTDEVILDIMISG